MIVQEMDFGREDYSKIVCLRDELNASGESHQFYRRMSEGDRRTFNPKILHFAFPHDDDERYWERTLVALYLWDEEKRGRVSFMSYSAEAFKKAADAVKELIAEPARETKSAIETICELGYYRPTHEMQERRR